VTGPGLVINDVAAQVFNWFVGAGNTQIGSNYQIAQNATIFVPAGIKIASNSSAFKWMPYT
jgi:acetyltransferase-like isoleucine patch superfamily enzyme